MQNDKKAVMKKITRGLSDDAFVEIKSGLKEGENVISGSFKAISRELEDGSLVKIEKNPIKEKNKIII